MLRVSWRTFRINTIFDEWFSFFAAIGSILGSIFNFLYGPDHYKLLSLFAFVIVIDWYTGIAAAKRHKTYSSAYGIDGVARTVFIAAIPVFANLVDQALSMPGTFFYGVTWGLIYHYWQSFTANAYRAGWGRWIPGRVVSWVDSEIKAKTERTMQQSVESEVDKLRKEIAHLKGQDTSSAAEEAIPKFVREFEEKGSSASDFPEEKK